MFTPPSETRVSECGSHRPCGMVGRLRVLGSSRPAFGRKNSSLPGRYWADTADSGHRNCSGSALTDPSAIRGPADLSIVRKKTTAIRRRRHWLSVVLVLVVLVAGLAGTAGVMLLVRQEQQRHAAALMDAHADDASQAVSREVARYRDTIADVAASIGAHPELGIDVYFAITSRLQHQRLAAASGVSFAVAANTAQVPEVQKRWRSRGAVALRLVPSPMTTEHVFPVFSRSFETTAIKPGTDLTRAAQPAEALRQARHTRLVVASYAFVLHRDPTLPAGRQQLSFIIAAPVFAAASAPNSGTFQGWVVIEMRGQAFLTEALQAQTVGPVRVSLSGPSQIPHPAVAHSAAGSTSGQPTLRRQRTVFIGQQAWQLEVSPTTSLIGATDRRMPLLTAAAGVLIAILLSLMTGVLAGSRNRALAKVDDATALLRQDIERRKELELHLSMLAMHDPLTGLANRTLLRERIGYAMEFQQCTAASVALLYIDLDGFKGVNDTLGHQAGDRLLVEVATRLRACLRSTDTVARLGGDEFAVLIENVATPDDAHVVARHALAALQRPFSIDGRRCGVTASIGLAIHALNAPDTITVDDLLRQADHAMYSAKTSGKNRYATTVDARPLRGTA